MPAAIPPCLPAQSRAQRARQSGSSGAHHRRGDSLGCPQGTFSGAPFPQHGCRRMFRRAHRDTAARAPYCRVRRAAPPYRALRAVRRFPSRAPLPGALPPPRRAALFFRSAKTARGHGGSAACDAPRAIPSPGSAAQIRGVPQRPLSGKSAPLARSPRSGTRVHRNSCPRAALTGLCQNDSCTAHRRASPAQSGAAASRERPPALRPSPARAAYPGSPKKHGRSAPLSAAS